MARLKALAESAWVWALGAFLILIVSNNNQLCGDEIIYMDWSRDGGLLGPLRVVGKEPLPITVTGIMFRIFGYRLAVGRIVSMIVASILLVLWIRIGRLKGIPAWFVTLFMFSSAYFVFYSRLHTYEVWLFTAITLLLYGVAQYEIDRKRAQIIIFVATLLGSLIKSSFIIALLAAPALLLLQTFAEGKKPQLRPWLLTCCCAVAGHAAALLFIASLGEYSHYQSMKNIFAVPPEEVLVKLRTFSWFGLKIFAIDTGYGFLAAIALLALFHAVKQRLIPALLGILIAVGIFHLNSNVTRWLWARYLLPVFPITLFVLFDYLEMITRPKIRTGILVAILCVQSWHVLRTTGPLLTDFKNVHWTDDEIDQHIIGIGTHGIFDIERELLKLASKGPISVHCSGQFTNYFCDYLGYHHPELVRSNSPHHVSYLLGTAPPPGAQVLYKFDQSVAGSPRQGYLYLLTGWY